MEEQGGHHAWPLPARPQHRQPEATGDQVEAYVELDTEPHAVAEARGLHPRSGRRSGGRAAYDRLSSSRKRQHVLAIDRAKKAQTRKQRIETALATLRDQE